MSDPRIAAQARILVRYSVKIRRGEVVGIYCPVPAADLAEEIYKEVIRAGGIPLLRLALPSISPFFYREASDAQLDHIGPNDWAEAKAQSARIIVIAETNPRAMTSVPPERITRFQKARRKLKEYLLGHTRWSLTLHPTESMAQEAEMSLEEYRDFVYGALFIGAAGDGAAAVRAWEKHEREQNAFARKLRGSKAVRIVGEGTDLTLSVRGRKWVPSPGTHNLPSGEVFTAPVDDSAEGVVAFDCPTSMGGRLIEGMTLRFAKGRVVEARATRGEEFLRKTLATDSGASRLGELGIGTNYGIRRATKEILLDEKIGGSIHLAVGSAYVDCGGINKSAIHWDMIKDLRPRPGQKGARIEVDGRVIQRDGKFLP